MNNLIGQYRLTYLQLQRYLAYCLKWTKDEKEREAIESRIVEVGNTYKETMGRLETNKQKNEKNTFEALEKENKSEKLKIGQEIEIIKKPARPTAVRVGDTATECGYTNMGLFEGQHQFHSKKLVDENKRSERYWVEFLSRCSYKLISKVERNNEND